MLPVMVPDSQDVPTAWSGTVSSDPDDDEPTEEMVAPVAVEAQYPPVEPEPPVRPVETLLEETAFEITLKPRPGEPDASADEAWDEEDFELPSNAYMEYRPRRGVATRLAVGIAVLVAFTAAGVGIGAVLYKAAGGSEPEAPVVRVDSSAAELPRVPVQGPRIDPRPVSPAAEAPAPDPVAAEPAAPSVEPAPAVEPPPSAAEPAAAPVAEPAEEPAAAEPAVAEPTADTGANPWTAHLAGNDTHLPAAVEVEHRAVARATVGERLSLSASTPGRTDCQVTLHWSHGGAWQSTPMYASGEYHSARFPITAGLAPSFQYKLMVQGCGSASWPIDGSTHTVQVF